VWWSHQQTNRQFPATNKGLTAHWLSSMSTSPRLVARLTTNQLHHPPPLPLTCMGATAVPSTGDKVTNKTDNDFEVTMLTQIYMDLST